ncbi:MAG: aldo/keto reductase [Acidobacteriota bacterium]
MTTHRPEPFFLYGTAWKEDDTQRLTLQALELGFRGIDTANQRRHYHEAGVGAALAEAFERKLVTRDDLFLQTKFTHRAGQDHRLPYDPDAPMATRVRQSAKLSLEHLGIERIDSYVLHGPEYRTGLSDGDREAWSAMEELLDEGMVSVLGVSNVSQEQLEELCSIARHRPVFVQNRCYAQLGWDAGVRELCREHEMVYQGFSLLTANGIVFQHPEFRALAERRGQTLAQLVFAFSKQVGMLPLTGSSSAEHLREDLACDEAGPLSDEELEQVEWIAT